VQVLGVPTLSGIEIGIDKFDVELELTSPLTALKWLWVSGDDEKKTL